MKTATTTKPAADKDRQAPFPSQGILQIPIKAIVIDEQSDRHRECRDPEADRELRESILEHGLLHPIGVLQLGENRYRLIYGHRRLAAVAGIGGSETIAAHVFASLTDSDVLQMRKIENLHRQNLNPIEEAIAVARLVDLITLDQGKHGEVDLAAAFKTVATQLAKPVQWVRDRTYLCRLSGKAKSLVLSGQLPLEHAKWISKLASPQLRDDLAQNAADDAGFNGLMPIEELKDIVRAHLHSLASVPWRLDRKFAGKPACDSCPHNSANVPMLFDQADKTDLHQHHEPARAIGLGKTLPKPTDLAGGVCTQGKCFEAKAAETRHAMTIAARRHAKALAEKNRSAATIAALDDPANHAGFGYLRDDLVVAQAKVVAARKKAIGTPPQAGTSTNSPGAAKKTEQQAAQSELVKALRARCELVVKHVEAMAKAKPAISAFVDLLTDSKEFRAIGAKKPTGPWVRSMLKCLANPTGEDLLRAAQKYGRGRTLIVEPWHHANTDLPELVAAATGLTLPPRPTLADFTKAAQKKPALSLPPVSPAPKAAAKPKNSKAAPAKHAKAAKAKTSPKPTTPAKAGEPKAKATKVAAPKRAERTFGALSVGGPCKGCGRSTPHFGPGKVTWANKDKTLCDECAEKAVDTPSEPPPAA